jgi:hypothetical protein
MALIHLAHESGHQIFVSGARMRDTGKRYQDDLLEMVNHHGFDRGRKMWQNLMMIIHPHTKKMPIKKARLTIVMPSLKGKKICPKGATSLRA